MTRYTWKALKTLPKPKWTDECLTSLWYLRRSHETLTAIWKEAIRRLEVQRDYFKAQMKTARLDQSKAEERLVEALAPDELK